ncbi:hypothetical protein JAO73_10415 [Hymenobacter sp. BT523]|uniref:hypothetical protein n=1 Tax=Hymenobacter sp. BT523 TaxID=2795725 RepID=UPI0018ED0D4C|nr:hypothetical protein [Hymenobacter sp. BT523]MBJ6109428.1 hypothetical protein [Hymenobacter sp. BT523]
MRLQAYTDLFKTAAAQHVAIGYTPDNGRFLRILVSSDPIAKQLDLTNFYDALRSRLKAKEGQPFLVLQNYDLDYDDNGGDHLSRAPHGAYYVLQKVKPGDYDARDAAVDACEEIAEDLLAYVVHHHRENYKIRMSVRDCFAEHVGPIGDNHVGVRMNFTWSETATQDLTFNPTKFTS